ncbi:cbb3-type cytochrome c oxidase subunit 3 [Saccharophagus sp. K07]|jgi:cytochrome c oxidase cbb3-type subunit 4|uniref:cbb3-type cytochrome oxidase subunit 3 n=1 Tax=Saccharophagus sp. K07 TaxID=2283636 RepID=UPI0016526D2E|nr:cbb3-type cytochrome c oxidase subunit 3 [Saccharophagus sp. K07]MBC6904677.1 cbb3-type cytochrome c oxidase subunit 3 [Saccharophagus sp. K07]
MDINTLRSISPILVLLAFIGVCWWAFSPKRRKRFDEAANLPFADENEKKDAQKTTSSEQERDKL